MRLPAWPAVLRRTLVPTQHLVHKLQNNSQGYLSPLTVLYLSVGEVTVVGGGGERVLAHQDFSLPT
jgi:hypothetical protein